MDFYTTNLTVLVAANGALAYRQRKQDAEIRLGDESDTRAKGLENDRAIASFRNRFFLVYMLVVASDWLQVGQTLGITPLCQ